MEKVIIEARVNEYAMRDRNPHVPWTVDELAREAEIVRAAGASILHFHARYPDGSPANDPQVYAEIIEAVRARTDILILPTLGFNTNDKDQDRIRIIRSLAENDKTKPDIIPLDTGTINLEEWDEEKHCFVNTEAVYSNPTSVLEYCADEMRARGIKCKMTCWDTGFVRRGSKLVETGRITAPGYFLFHLTDGRFLNGIPCTEAGVDAMRSALPKEKCYWSCNCKGGNLLRVAPHVLKNGGGIAIGIGDYDYAEIGAPTNEELVKTIVKMAADCGREIASVEETKQILGI